MIILGIDPGSNITGYGLIRIEKSNFIHLSHGVIRASGGASADSSKTKDFADRIHQIGLGLRDVIREFKPQIAVIEKIFLARNVDSAFKLGHARGVCMYEATSAGLEVVEYATREVKKGVTGTGGADKEQVQLILSRLLGIKLPMKLDASDALAMAYYHGLRLEMDQKMNRMKELS